MAQIALEHISKQYKDGFEAVKDLNLDIADGEFMILVGPSGCGKSTALRMVAGLEDITGGELKIGGQVVNEHRPERHALLRGAQHGSRDRAALIHEAGHVLRVRQAGGGPRGGRRPTRATK